MLALLLRRLLVAVPLALGATLLVFALMETAPGDPVDLWIGDRPVPAEARERIERAYGFDRPAPERYVRWLGALALEGEMGWSHSRGRPVRQALVEALGPTLQLALAALAIHVLAGVGLGVVSAVWNGRRPERLLSGAALLLYAMPTFWVALMAVLVFSVGLGWFPSSSLQSVGAGELSAPARALDRLHHLALPALTLGLASAAAMTRFVRSGLLRALGEPFVRAARARGLRRPAVLLHALRTALLPVITLVGLSLPALLSGSLVVEVVFSWPGMGRLTYDAIRAQDPAVVLGATLVSTLLVVLGSLAADLAMAWADPRVRLAGRGSDA